ncbi:ketoacyl-ACP synthase III family protein [Parahaliea sp. F7430]|uniref:Ketoacyl-ACP synthase III family protein n=1 Tax=Sediminihaliea albiluteola TaxID=2758564 RepID=A0A7W2TWC1_9GAMM|nr:ketoacyl-ACP synthase III family protein [Sediminihaliea albiluteola]MBA6413160.1 ketoacyl-ACP synthase III family protein [Sediminihaliea albiluteola]
MKNELSILGTGVYLPPARPVKEVVAEAGQDPSGYQGWDNCCHALEDDHPSTMGVAALRKAMEDAKVDPSELKLVIFAGMSRDYLPSWSVATEIMKACGTEAHCMGLDMTVGCLGALSALDMAQGWLAAHGGGVAAIVAAERWTYTVDYTSIENMGLWGHSDGAAATVVGHKTSHESKGTFCGAEFITQSDLNGTVLVEYGGTRNPVAPAGVKPFERKLMGLSRHDLRQRYSDGYAGSLQALKARFDCNAERVIINQTANLFLQLIAAVIEIPTDNFVMTGHETGHVGSADILIGLDRLLKTDGLDQPYLMLGSTPYAFGSGLLMPA